MSRRFYGLRGSVVAGSVAVILLALTACQSSDTNVANLATAGSSAMPSSADEVASLAGALEKTRSSGGSSFASDITLEPGNERVLKTKCTGRTDLSDRSAYSCDVSEPAVGAAASGSLGDILRIGDDVWTKFGGASTWTHSSKDGFQFLYVPEKRLDLVPLLTNTTSRADSEGTTLSGRVDVDAASAAMSGKLSQQIDVSVHVSRGGMIDGLTVKSSDVIGGDASSMTEVYRFSDLGKIAGVTRPDTFECSSSSDPECP